MPAFGLSADTLRIVAGRSCERLAKRDGTWIVVRSEACHDCERADEVTSSAETWKRHRNASVAQDRPKIWIE